MAENIQKNVLINLKLTDQVSTNLSGIKNALTGLQSTINDVATGFSNIAGQFNAIAQAAGTINLGNTQIGVFSKGVQDIASVDVNSITKLVESIVKLDGVKIDDSLGKLSKLGDLGGLKFPSFQPVYTLLEKLKGAKIDNLPDFSAFGKGLQSFKDVTIPSNLKDLSKLKELSGITLPTGFDQFIKQLAKLGQVGKFPSIGTFAKNLKLFDGITFPDMKSFSKALERIGSIGKFPKLTEFVTGLKSLQKLNVERIQTLRKSLSKFSAIGNFPSVSKFVNSLRELSSLKIPSLKEITRQIVLLGNALQRITASSPFIQAMDYINRSAGKAEQAMAGVTRQAQTQLGVWDRLGTKVKNYLGYRLIADSVVALKEAFRAGTTTIIEYDQALKDLQAITGATDLAVTQMGEKIKQVASTTKFSASEVAVGMRTLGQAGFTATEAIDTMQAVSDLATGTLSDMATSVDLVSTAMRVFAIDSTQSARVSDVFANAVNRSKLTIDKIRIAMNYVGPIAKAAGVTFEETAAAMGTLANAGQRASTIGTGLRRIFAELVDPSDELAASAQRAGIALEDLDPRTRSLSEVIGNLRLVITDSQQAFQLFGKRGAAAALNLISTEANYDQMLQTMSRTGTAAQQAAKQMEGLGVSFKNLRDKIGLIAIALGEAGITRVMKIFVDVARVAVDILARLISTPFGKFITSLTLATTAVLSLVAAFGLLRQMAIGTWIARATTGLLQLAGASSSAAGGVALLNAAVTALAGPLGAILIVAGLIGAAFTVMISRLDDAEKAVEKFTQEASQFEKIKDNVDNFTERIGTLKEGTTTAKVEMKKYRDELFQTAKNNDELAGAALKAANSMDVITGKFLDGGKAVADFRDEAAKLELDTTIKAYESSVDALVVHTQDGTAQMVAGWKDAWTTTKGIFKDGMDGLIEILEFDSFEGAVNGYIKVMKNTVTPGVFAKIINAGFRETEGDILAEQFEKKEITLKQLGEGLEALDPTNIDAIAQELKGLYDLQVEKGAEALKLLRDTGRISLADTSETIRQVAISSGFAEEKIEGLVTAFEIWKEKAGEQDTILTDKWRREFEESENGLLDFLDTYKSAGGIISAQQEKQLAALEDERKALIDKTTIMKGLKEAELSGVTDLKKRQDIALKYARQEQDLKKQITDFNVRADSEEYYRKLVNHKAAVGLYNQQLSALEDVMEKGAIAAESAATKRLQIEADLQNKIKSIFTIGGDPEEILSNVKENNRLREEELKNSLENIRAEEAKGVISHARAEQEKTNITVQALSQRLLANRSAYEQAKATDPIGEDTKRLQALVLADQAAFEKAKTDNLISSKELRLEALESELDKETTIRETRLAKQQQYIEQLVTEGVITTEQATAQKSQLELKFYADSYAQAVQHFTAVAGLYKTTDVEYTNALKGKLQAEEKYYQQRSQLLEKYNKEVEKAQESINKLNIKSEKEQDKYETKIVDIKKKSVKDRIKVTRSYKEKISEIEEALAQKLEAINRSSAEKYEEFAQQRVDAERKASADIIGAQEDIDDMIRKRSQEGKSDRKVDADNEAAALDKLRRGIALVAKARREGDKEALAAGKELIDDAASLYDGLENNKRAIAGLKQVKDAYNNVFTAEEDITNQQIDKEKEKIDSRSAYAIDKAKANAKDEADDAETLYKQKIKDINDIFDESTEKEEIRHKQVMQDILLERKELVKTLTVAQQVLESATTQGYKITPQAPSASEVQKIIEESIPEDVKIDWELSRDADTGSVIATVKRDIGTVEVPVKADVDKTEVEQTKQDIDQLPSKAPTVSINVFGMETLQQAIDKLAQIQDKVVTVTIKYVTEGAPPNVNGQEIATAFNGGLIGMFNSGGSVFNKLASPFISAGKGFLDDVPALLSKGEFVQRAKAVREYGVGFMRSVNNLQFPKSFARMFSGGGLTSGLSEAAAGVTNSMTIPSSLAKNLKSSIDQSSISTYNVTIGDKALRPRGKVTSLTSKLVKEVKRKY